MLPTNGYSLFAKQSAKHLTNIKFQIKYFENAQVFNFYQENILVYPIRIFC